MKRLFALTALAAIISFFGLSPARSEELPPKYKESVKKALEYLKKQQFKDGHWGANGDNYPVTMTALAGIAMLMEGSNVREGQYSANIRKSADWLMERSMRANNRDGLIGNPDHPTEAGRYMYGHGFATLYLACVYGDDEDRERREKLKDILTRACKYIGNAQSTKGGWFYTSRVDGHDQDEGSVTVTQMQALRACKNAGISVNKDIIKKGSDYLKKSTSGDGGVMYRIGGGFGGGKPALTAAAIACLFSAGEYKDEYVKKWFQFGKRTIPLGQGRIGHDEYTQFYWGQAVYFLGDDGWEKMFNEKNGMTWTAYKKDMFDNLVATQAADGSYQSAGGFGVGPVYSTAIYAIIMQLDLGTLPIFQR